MVAQMLVLPLRQGGIQILPQDGVVDWLNARIRFTGA